MTQKGLADATGLSHGQVYRYESGASQPTLDAIKRLAVELGVSADELLFDDDERGPSDDLRLQFEALARMSPKEREVARTVLEGLIIRHDAQQWTAQEQPEPATGS